MNFTSLIALLIALSTVQAFKEPPKVQVCNIALCSKCKKLTYYPSKLFIQNQLQPEPKSVYKFRIKVFFQWRHSKFNESVPSYCQGVHAAVECKRILVSSRYSNRLPMNWIQTNFSTSFVGILVNNPNRHRLTNFSLKLLNPTLH